MQVEQELLDLHTGWLLTESDYTRCCINPKPANVENMASS